MKFLADENVKRRLGLWLKTQGHHVSTADKGVRNSHLFALAHKEKKILLTNDTDFLSTALYPPEKTFGRIVLRILPPTLEYQKTGLQILLAQFNQEHLFLGKLIELWNNDFEVRTK